MQRKKETEVSELEKQKFYEKRKHGTPRFPMECFVTRADGNQHFLVPLHWHRNIEIMQMLHGTAVITIGNETFSAVEGDIFCINQEELHRIVSEDNQLVYRTVIFPLQALTFSESDAAQTYLEQIAQGVLRFPVQVTNETEKYFLRETLYQIQIATEQKSVGYELMVKAQLLQIIAQMLCQHQIVSVQHSPSEKSKRLKEMLHFIQRHYAAPLTITVMAEQFHMSEKYFSRYFRIATGQNFTAYLNAVRIEKAQALILETDETVLEIAFSCGYENVSYFNRVFRRQTGYSPLQYRSIAVS